MNIAESELSFLITRLWADHIVRIVRLLLGGKISSTGLDAARENENELIRYYFHFYENDIRIIFRNNDNYDALFDKICKIEYINNVIEKHGNCDLNFLDATLFRLPTKMPLQKPIKKSITQRYLDDENSYERTINVLDRMIQNADDFGKNLDLLQARLAPNNTDVTNHGQHLVRNRKVGRPRTSLNGPRS